MKKLIIILAVLAVLGFGGYYYASPYLAVYAVKKAVEAGDADRLSSYVDYPLLRDSLRKQIDEKMTDMPGGDLGQMLAGAIAGGLVDAIVTPEGLKAVLSAREPEQDGSGGEPSGEPSQDVREENKSQNPMKMGYESLSVFAVTVFTKSGEESAKVILSRYGLFGWKLTAVEIID